MMLYGGMVNHDTHFLTPYYKQEPKSPSEHITKLLEAQEFPINSYVLAEYETQIPSKLRTPLHGPYRVVARVGNVYTIENLQLYMKFEDEQNPEWREPMTKKTSIIRRDRIQNRLRSKKQKRDGSFSGDTT